MQQRLDILPIEIPTARIMELKEQLDELEQRKAEVGAKLPDLKAAEQQAFDRMKAAGAEHLAAQQAYQRAQNELHSLASQLGQLRVRFDQVLAEGVATGPVVRSAWEQR
jgi:chromosome segregation ATPase